MSSKIESLGNDDLRDISTYCIGKIQPRVSNFEEAVIFITVEPFCQILFICIQEAKFREHLSEVYIADEDFTTAARTLSAINVESPGR